MRVTRMLVIIFSLLLVALMSVSVASAAPTNAPNVEAFLIECDNGQSYTVVANGNGSFSPGHIVAGDGRVVIPVAFTFVAMDAAGNVIFNESFGKKGQRKGVAGDLITCTFGGTFEENGQTFTFFGTVTGFIAPRS
jgi:hypothetical protein